MAPIELGGVAANGEILQRRYGDPVAGFSGTLLL